MLPNSRPLFGPNTPSLTVTWLAMLPAVNERFDSKIDRPSVNIFCGMGSYTVNYQSIIDRYYPSGTPQRDIYMRHCRSVADLALEIARCHKLQVDLDDVEAAAMLHDIGIFLTDAAGIHCHGHEPYITHGMLGARLLRELHAPGQWAAVAEHHTGAGITSHEVELLNLPLPVQDWMPLTTLEKLVCYADKFYSKNGDMKQKSLERVRQSMARHGGDTLVRFEKLHRQFAIDRTSK